MAVELSEESAKLQSESVTRNDDGSDDERDAIFDTQNIVPPPPSCSSVAIKLFLFLYRRNHGVCGVKC